MEGKFNQGVLKLQQLKVNDLRNVCKKLKLKCSGKRTELESRLITFLLTPEGQKEARETLDPSFITNFYSHSTQLTNCICAGKGAGQTISCTRCKGLSHVNCISHCAKMNHYECPECQFLQMEPLDQVVECIVKPFLVVSKGISNSNTQHFEFPQDKLEQLFKAKGELQVQVRCLKLDGSGFTQQWPKLGCLVLNEALAQEFRPPQNHNAKKRKDEPLNVTMILKNQNSISIVKMNDPDTYVAGVFIVSIKKEEEVIRAIKLKPKVSIQEAKLFVTKKLNLGDSEIGTQCVKLSVKCPFTMTLMETPVRGVNCDHIQCFNLDPFIRLQRSSRVNRWKCPICKGFAFNLVVDEFFETIIEEARKVEDPHGVELYNDASYRIIDFEEYLVNQEKTTQKNPFKRKLTETNPVPSKKLKSSSEGSSSCPIEL